MQRLGTSDAGEGWHPVRVSPAIEPAMSASASTPSHGRSASVGGGSPPVIAGPGASDSSKRSSVAGTKSSAKVCASVVRCEAHDRPQLDDNRSPAPGAKCCPSGSRTRTPAFAWSATSRSASLFAGITAGSPSLRRRGILFMPHCRFCRSCGHVVCKDCSGHKLILPFTHSQKPVRICDKCYKLLSPGATSDGKGGIVALACAALCQCLCVSRSEPERDGGCQGGQPVQRRWPRGRAAQVSSRCLGGRRSGRWRRGGQAGAARGASRPAHAADERACVDVRVQAVLGARQEHRHRQAAGQGHGRREPPRDGLR